MGKIVKLKNKKTGERVYPVTATKAVVDADSGERLNDVLLNKVEEAPMDGLQYVRSGGTWVMADIPDTAAMEKCNITLLSNQGAPDVSLIGASIVVMDVTGGSELLNTRWNGDKFTVEVEDGHEYKVTVGSVEGYLTPSVQDLTAMAGIERDLEFQYKTEVVTVSLSASNGASVNGQIVTINGKSHTYNGSPISQKIPFGTSYDVQASTMIGFIALSKQSFTAETTSRNVSMVYQAASLGFYIEDTLGGLHTRNSWDGTMTPNAIIFISSSIRRRIALEMTGTGKTWLGTSSSYVNAVGGISLDNYNLLQSDYDGASKGSILRGIEGNQSGYYATDAYNYRFPNGLSGGHIPAAGELREIINNINTLRQYFSAVGLSLSNEPTCSHSTPIVDSMGTHVGLYTPWKDSLLENYGGFGVGSGFFSTFIITNY